LLTALKQMAYLIFIANGEEYDRRELRGPILLGRAPDCDLAIPDITLSRHHCRVEPSENGRGWQLLDLHSKNGTQFRGQNIESHVLRDGDELRIGRTRLTFKVGKFVKASGKSRPQAVIRAVDPHEALSGTVSGMVVCEPGEAQKHEGMPVPQPRPLDPSSYQNDDIYGMINEIASSSFDSTHAQNSKPVRMQRAAPVPGVTQAEKPRSQPRVSFELQADHSESQAGMVSSEIIPDGSVAGASLSGGSLSGQSLSGRSATGRSVSGKSVSGRSVSGAALSRHAQRRESTPIHPAPLLAPVRSGRHPKLIIGAAAGVAAVVSLAAWAMLVRGHEDANQADSLITAPKPEPPVDSTPAPVPLAITAGAVDPGLALPAVPASHRNLSHAGEHLKPRLRAAVSVPPAERLDHLTTFELIFPATAAQRPRPTDIAPDDLLGASLSLQHRDPLANP
jgi:hypothetical protein